MVKIHFIEAYNGDCFLITDNKTNILIDGGTPGTYLFSLEKMIKNLKKIDLLVVTHVDNDHVGGIIKLIKDKKNNRKVKKVFFNSGASLGEKIKSQNEINISESTLEKSVLQGVTLEKKLIDLNDWNREQVTNESNDIKIGDFKIKVLLPFKSNIEALNEKWDEELKECKKKLENRKEKSGVIEVKNNLSIENLIKNPEEIKTTLINESSIVLLIEVNNKKLLFTGDTSAKNLIKVLKDLKYSKENPINLDLFKIPHHGSKYNMN